MNESNRIELISLKEEIILSSFKERTIYSENNLYNILKKNRAKWGLSKSIKFDDFYNFLLDENILLRYLFDFPNTKIKRYLLNSKTLYADDYRRILNLTNTLSKSGYFTHYTAAFLNGMTENIVKTLYFSYKTATRNKSKSKLIQENIDRAFSKPARKTRKFTFCDSYKIILLENTFRNEGVLEEFDEDFNQAIAFSNVEKTLIDIAVRPEYSGGVFEVLKIYKNCVNVASVNKMRAYLKRADYTYPYNQVVGFYLEHAGFGEGACKLMETFPIEFDFYLTNEIKEKEYSKRWKLYYPRGLI